MLRFLRRGPTPRRSTRSRSYDPVFSSRQRFDMAGTLLFGLAICLSLSMIPPSVFGPLTEEMFPMGNFMGVVGAVVFQWGWAALGAGLILLPLPPLIAGAACFNWIDTENGIRWGAFTVGLALLTPLVAFQLTGQAGTPLSNPLPSDATGWLGQNLGLLLAALFSWFGALLATAMATVLLSTATIGWNPLRALPGIGPFVARLAADIVARLPWTEPADDEEDEDAFDDHPYFGTSDEEQASLLTRIRGRLTGEEAETSTPDPVERLVAATETAPADEDDGTRPAKALLSLGDDTGPAMSEDALDRMGDTLLQTLDTFSIEGRIVGRTTGPVVTQFEVVPAPGIKVSKIANLDADLALALKAPSVRVVAPIPGKGAVGVEVPNPDPEIVYLREIIESETFADARGPLPLALGKDLTGKPVVTELSKMPHVLIAGATGSGKSVCVNTIITSLIYRHSPETLRLLMVDPKMVELSMYQDLPHLRHPVVTDPREAADVLRWAVLEMEHRYNLLSANRARSVQEFNQKLARGRPLVNPDPAGKGEDPYDGGPLPFIVLVIDELADLMMTVGSDVEKPLAQLAQKARAIGIHLIVATQRPSVNVITGLIKANFPSRIAFRVSSKVDSRTILDQNGADALLGNGDMLFLPPGTSDPTRVQGAFMSSDDAERLMDWYRDEYGEHEGDEDDIVETIRELDQVDEIPNVDEERDELFESAAEICVQYQQGSTSLLQRRLRVGYGRAARIIDQLHHAGILGPPEGSKPREVLVGGEEGLELLLAGDP